MIVLLFLWHLATCLHLAQADSTPNASPSQPEYNEAVDNGTFGYYPIRTYATAEGLTSPQTNFLQWSPRCDDGLSYFITPRGWSLPNPGPMILDRHGELVWSKHFANKFGGQAYDFMVQTYDGQEFLTFWLGDDRVRGHGSGFYYMLNSSYDIVHKVGAANGLSADLHEFLITPEGTALMTMYQIAPQDVTAFREFDPENPEDHDPNYIWDCIFQEVTVDTQELVFEWRASEHLNINDTYHGIGPGGTKNDPFDWFHINSIEKDELGNYLISARYTHSITYVDGKSGDVIWTLGGRSNNFMDLSDGFAINFAWQHDARFLPTNTFPNMYTPPADRPGYTTKLVTLFDNAAEDQHYEYGLTYSRGLLLEVTFPDVGHFIQKESEVDLSRRQEYTEPDLNNQKVRETNGTDPDYTVRVIKSYENPRKVRSSSQGSVQVIPQDSGDPKVLVGYGLNALWTEFEADGTVLCDVHFGADISWERGDIQSYRAYKFPWTGRPETKPLVEISDDDVEAYVSWNGATDVVDWILQCSDTETDDEQAWADVVRVSKSGFETIITIPDTGLGDARYLRIIALGEAGRRLDYGVSRIIDRGLMASYFPLLSNTHLPDSMGRISLVKLAFIVASVLSGMYLLFEVYRRYLVHKMGRPGVGALRWRKGPAYRLVGDA
ncbi:hypothetical protein LTR85_011389 [Meristemomyces frigidus]|nr:hypothetical protein LTR85_011389 [Meristemomyces frigidus]